MHTLLRLPTGLFYAQGVKANVVTSGCIRQLNSVQALVGKQRLVLEIGNLTV